MGGGVRALICTFVGHRWEPSPESESSVLVLRCRRCGTESVHTSDTFDAENRFDRISRPWRPKS